MLKLKPEDTLNYLRTRLVKENKIRTEINLRNNNLFKNISLYDTLNKLNINSLPNDNTYNKISNQNTKPKEKKNDNESQILVLKKIKLNHNQFKLFSKTNRINIEMLKKHLNIKKKKFNKGIDFCSYFLRPRNNYYINALNDAIINNFISFYIKAKEYNSNIEIDINKDINCNSFKIYNIKYPMLIVKGLSIEESLKFDNNRGGENKVNIYEKCINILKEDNCENINEEKDDKSSKTFLKGLNHNIRYDLEQYLENKIKLIDLNDRENALFKKSKYLNKYQFQFIEKINSNSNNIYIPIDKNNIIPDKKFKYSFNEPRSMYPLFIKGIFDKINVYNQFSNYKSKTLNSHNSGLNLFFEKSIDRPKEIKLTHIFSDLQKSQDSINILNGYYLINPLQNSINNKEFIKKLNRTILPKKLNKDLKSILGSKFNYNKYKVKRNYLTILNNDNAKINKKESDIKLILINKNTANNYINNPEEYIIFDDEEMDFDIIFDINICAKIYYVSEFYDQFQYNGYNSVCDLINKNYLYFNKFYVFLINDEKMNRNTSTLKKEEIVNSIYKIIDDKFNFLMNGKYEFNVNVKVVENPHLINYEINHLYDELNNNNYNDELSVFNKKIISKLLKEIRANADSNKNKIKKETKKDINQKTKFNIYEDYLLISIQNPELKDEIQKMINKKYSKLNLI